MKPIFQKLLLFSTTLTLILSSCMSQPTEMATPEPVKLKVSVLPFISYAPFFIALEEGFFAEQGLEVEFLRIEATSEAMPALASGELDVAAGFYDVSTLNAIAQGGKIKYVSDKGYLNPQSCSFVTWLVRQEILDSGLLDDPKNLKGMKIALTPASAAEYALYLLLQEAGLSESDVEVLNIPVPNRNEALSNGSIDIAATGDPWIVRAINAGVGNVWRPWNEYMPNFQFSIIMYGPNLLEKNIDAGRRFMIAYLKAVRQYNQGKTDRNVEIIAKYTQMTPEEVRQSCWMAMKSDGRLVLEGMQGFQDWAFNKDLLISKVPEDQLIDLSFVEYANQYLEDHPE